MEFLITFATHMCDHLAQLQEVQGIIAFFALWCMSLDVNVSSFQS